MVEIHEESQRLEGPRLIGLLSIRYGELILESCLKFVQSLDAHSLSRSARIRINHRVRHALQAIINVP